MLELYVMRHAESGYEQGEKDFDRSLTQKGIVDAKKMYDKLLKQVDFDLVICSDANRTVETLSNLSLNAKKLIYDRGIYEAALEDILRFVCGLEGNKVLYLGHNPGVTELVEYLTGYDLVGMVPGSCTKVVSNLDCWGMSSQNLFEFEWYQYPEMF